MSREKQKLHVVVAERGEYSDRAVWNVKGFFDEEIAKQFCIDQKKRDIIAYAVERHRRQMASDQMRGWKEENPPPVENTPERPKYDYPGMDNRTAQHTHKKLLDEWAKACIPGREAYRAAKAEWDARFTAKQAEVAKYVQEHFTEAMLVITPDMATSFNETRYRVDTIEICGEEELPWYC